MKVLLFLALQICQVYASNIIIIADVHGDIPRLQTILQDSMVIDAYGVWIAPENTLVIQLGDQIDPKDIDKDDIPNKHHFAMLYYTYELQKQAKNKKSDFISHIGNHELKNIVKIKTKNRIREIISFRPVVSIVNGYLFCHGGFKMHHYHLLNSYNMTINSVNDVWFKFVTNLQLTPIETVILDNLILDKRDGILYTRTQDDKDTIDKLLDIMNLYYMFVGHTETTNIYVKDRIWHLDLILKSAFDKNEYNYIQIIDDNIIVKCLSRNFEKLPVPANFGF
jgi:hypothetical protein